MTVKKETSYTIVKGWYNTMTYSAEVFFYNLIYRLQEFALLAEELYGRAAYDVTDEIDNICDYIIVMEAWENV